MKKTDLSIVILNYNSLKYINDCLESIRKSNLHRVKVEIIVIDNASIDGSQRALKKVKDIEFIPSKTNKGFAGGNNLAKGKTHGKYILFLNPDTVLDNNTLFGVWDYMEKHDDVGVATCKLLTAQGEFDYAAHRGFPTPLNALFYFLGLSKRFTKSKFFTGYTQGWKRDNPQPHEVEVISGAFFFIRSKLAEQVGWWDEDYFFYGEDIEFSWRVKSKGWKIVYIPYVKMLHYGGVTSGIRRHTKKISAANKETKIRSVKASTKAMEIFYKKHYLNKYPKFVSLLALFGIKVLERFRVSRV
jgi:GT2 family glycosyltransferase